MCRYVFQGGVRSRPIGNLACVSGSGEGVEASRASAITVTFGLDDPASNSSPRLQIFLPFFFFFILFAYCLRLKPVRRNSSKEIVGSGSIRIFLFLFFFLFFSLGNGIKLRMESKWKRWTCRTLNVRSSYDYAIPFLANFIRNNRMCLNTRVDKIWNWKLNNPCIRVCRG